MSVILRQGSITFQYHENVFNKIIPWKYWKWSRSLSHRQGMQSSKQLKKNVRQISKEIKNKKHCNTLRKKLLPSRINRTRNIAGMNSNSPKRNQSKYCLLIHWKCLLCTFSTNAVLNIERF